MKKLKIIWLATWWPRPDHPVLGTFTKREAEAVAPHCELVIIHALPTSSKQHNIVIQNAEAGYREVLVHCPKRKGIFGQILFLRGWELAMQSVVDEGFKPDIVHLHVLSLAGIAALKFHRKNHVPVILSEHWSGYSLDKISLGIIRKWLYKKVVATAHINFVVTENMEQAMKKMGLKGAYSVAPNLVDTAFFMPTDTPVSSIPFQFLHVSNLDDEHKNISGILRAFAKIITTYSAHLTLIGGDNGIAHVQHLIKELNLEKYVTVKGVQPSLIVRQQMQLSHAFVMFSNREGLPCVMLEAMAVGLPIISTSIPGLEDWVTPEVGMLVSKGDEVGLKVAMREMVDNFSSYNRAKIRERVMKECNPDVVAQRILTAYKDAATATKRS
ncbi:MAG: glycosyltransferase [Bacteroidetes bacterium]|nr:glycosyltransferase [Bacteroidota bacterium]